MLADGLIWNCLASKDSHYVDERQLRGIVMNLKPSFDP
jgi:hypothetical protein